MDNLSVYITGEYLKKLDQIVMSLENRLKTGLAGARKAQGKGNSIEFSDFRNYVAGDDIRRLDWNSFARFDKLFIKIFTEERQATINIYLDASASMDYGGFNKLLFGKIVAASLSYICIKNADKLNLHVIKDGKLSDSLTGISTKLRFREIVDFLDKIEPTGKTNLSAALSRPVKSSGLSVIISDFFTEDAANAAKKLLYSGSGLCFVHVLSKEEETAEIGKKLRLTDSETNEYRDLEITKDVADNYNSSLKNFKNEVKAICEKFGGLYVFSSTAQSPVSVLQRFL